MPIDTGTAIACTGAFAALVGGGVAMFNSWKGVCWKRAELASSYLRDLTTNDELVFACRCLDWSGGRLVVPQSLRPLLTDGGESIEHDRSIFAIALRPDLSIREMNDDPRIQIYRCSVDSFLSWLNVVASALNRKLFYPDDLEEVGYWVAKIESEPSVHAFIAGFGYQENISKLVRLYRTKQTPYRDWVFRADTPDEKSGLEMPVARQPR
jgi:hypothetical protein